MTTFIVVPKRNGKRHSSFAGQSRHLLYPTIAKIDDSEWVSSLSTEIHESARERNAIRYLEALDIFLFDNLSVANIQDLSAEAEVLESFDIGLVQPLVSGTAQQTPWHLQDINASTLWNQGITGKGVRIGILDSGINAAHSEFAGKSVSFMEFDALGFQTNTSARDHGNHGTHVAGIAAGNKCGVAPDADLAVAAVMTGSNGTGTLAQILAGLNWLIHANHAQDGEISRCQVINASLGTQGYNSYLYSTVAIQSTLNASLLVAAIGNKGLAGADRHGSPGNYDVVLGVGATNQNGIVCGFSDWGYEPTHSAYKPDMCAPGEDILSANAQNTSGFVAMSGTSMASPMVSGSAALLIQRDPVLASNPSRLHRELLLRVDSSKNHFPGNVDPNNTPNYSRIRAGKLHLW